MRLQHLTLLAALLATPLAAQAMPSIVNGDFATPPGGVFTTFPGG